MLPLFAECLPLSVPGRAVPGAIAVPGTWYIILHEYRRAVSAHGALMLSYYPF